MASVLREIAQTSDEVAEDQRAVARRARSLDRQRQRGRSWAEILANEPDPSLLVMLSRSVRRLVTATARFRHGLARELSAEGWSRRQIGRVFGVTHQRVTALLRVTPAAATGTDDDRP